VGQLDRVDELGDGRADHGPVRLGLVAGAGQRRAKRLQAGFIAQVGESGPAQKRPQRRIAERCPIEFAKMRVAAAVP
jgi:hypothetical protein